MSSQGQLGCPRVAYPMTTIEKTLTLIPFRHAASFGRERVWWGSRRSHMPSAFPPNPWARNLCTGSNRF